MTGAIIQLLDAGMLALAGSHVMAGAIGFDGALVSVVALMSSFGPVIALANLAPGLQSTFAAATAFWIFSMSSPLCARSPTAGTLCSAVPTPAA